MRSKLILIIIFLYILTFIVCFSSCKKDKSDIVRIDLEQLGSLKPMSENMIWFNFDGNPMVCIEANKFLYEWNSSSKDWVKVGNEMPGGNRFEKVVQDNQGNYFGRYSNFIFELNKNTKNWDTLHIVENNSMLTGGVNELLSNANGDVLFQIQKKDKYQIYIKKANSNTWGKIIEYEKSNDDHRPYFFTISGIVYFTGNTIPSPYPHGILRDKIFNINTGEFGLLFDKSELQNYNYSPFGSLSTAHIENDGTVYFIYQDGATIYKAELMKISPNNYPAMITKIKDITVPGLHSSGGWSPTTKGIAVDAFENIKTHIGCNNSRDPAHMAEATIKNSSSEIKTYKHPINRRSIYSNFNNEVFVLENLGNLYKWK